MSKPRPRKKTNKAREREEEQTEPATESVVISSPSEKRRKVRGTAEKEELQEEQGLSALCTSEDEFVKTILKLKRTAAEKARNEKELRRVYKKYVLVHCDGKRRKIDDDDAVVQCTYN